MEEQEQIEIKNISDESVQEQSENKIEAKQKKQRKRLSFPPYSFEDALDIAHGIWECASGKKVRRLTLFDHLNKAPDSGPSRAMITASSRYGLTTGGYQADYIELTDLGAKATNPDGNLAEKLSAQFELSINRQEFFKCLYDQFKDIKLPSTNVMTDYLIDQGLTKDEGNQCVNVFLNNCKYLNLLQVLAGAERILNYDYWLEKVGCTNSVAAENVRKTLESNISIEEKDSLSENTVGKREFCFYIAPIGEDGSEIRQHSDLFLNQIVEPALREFNLEVIRADSINQAGMITSQIINHIRNAKLVVADLSFHNPNVFYELAFRHTLNLPTIHIIRKSDSIPFDLNDFRTITIDDSSIYTLLPQLETFKRQIAMQAKSLLENESDVKNPITSSMPSKL